MWGGGAPESSVGATKSAGTELPSKPCNWSDLAGDWLLTGVVEGGGGDVARGTREQCGSNEECTVSLHLKNLTTGDGVVAGGGDVGGGAPESSVGATKIHQFPPRSSLKNLTTGPIWLDGVVAGGRCGGGGNREQCGSNEECTGSRH